MTNNNYEDFDARVDRFLRDEMTLDEIIAFKAELTVDTEKMQRAKTIVLMIKSMQKIGVERDRAIIDIMGRMTEDQFCKVAGIKSKPRIVRLLPAIGKYAAVACLVGCLVFGGFRYYEHQQVVSLGNTEYLAYVSDLSMSDNLNISRGSDKSDTVLIELTTLFDNVKDNNEIGSTIKQLEDLHNLAQNESSEYWYYLDDITWNLALAYLKDGNKEKPVPLLKEMIERNGTYPDIVDPAQKLIDKINDL